MNLPGMAFPAFIPKISNYADIALVYKWYKIGNVSPAYSNSYSSPGTYSVGDVIIMFVESVNEVNTINTAGYIKIADILGNGTTLSMY